MTVDTTRRGTRTTHPHTHDEEYTGGDSGVTLIGTMTIRLRGDPEETGGEVVSSSPCDTMTVLPTFRSEEYTSNTSFPPPQVFGTKSGHSPLQNQEMKREFGKTLKRPQGTVKPNPNTLSYSPFTRTYSPIDRNTTIDRNTFDRYII